MNTGRTPQFLPALMGTLRQEGNDGVLVLDQNDCVRHLYWVNGNLVYLKSDSPGEQFGNYLIRQGVLDWDALNELLSDTKGPRFGDRLVKWGLLSEKERDNHLYNLMRQILLHAMEHPIRNMQWNDAPVGGLLDLDLYFPLDYRRMVWETFQELANLSDVCDLFRNSPDWRWEAPSDLLESLKDLPLTPQMAYTLTFVGKDPIGFEMLSGLTGMEEEDAARLIGTLWALGGLNLSQGEMPSPARKRRLNQPITPPMVPILTTPATPPQTKLVPPPLLAPPLPPPPSKSPQPPAALPPLSFSAPPPPAPAAPLPPLSFPPPAPPAKIELDNATPSEDQESGTEPGVNEISASDRTLSPEQNALKLFKRAKYLLAQVRTSETVRLLEEAVKLDPGSPNAYDSWLLLGRVRLANPAWTTRAMDALQTAARLRPKAGEPYALIGELYHRKGFKVEAAQNYRKAIELNPLITIPKEVDMTAADVEPEPPPPEPTFWERVRGVFTPQGRS